MIKGKLLKDSCKDFKDITIEDFPNKDDDKYIEVLNFFRHIDNSWFDRVLKGSNIKGIQPKKARRVVTASIRKMMEAKKR